MGLERLKAQGSGDPSVSLHAQKSLAALTSELNPPSTG